MERFGSANDIIEDFNGGQGNIVYLLDDNPKEVIRQYNQIKSAKAIIGSYSIGRKHCLIVQFEGIIKKKIVKKNNRSK